MNPYSQALLEAVTPLINDGPPDAVIPAVKLALQSDATEGYLYYILGNRQFEGGACDEAAVALDVATHLLPKQPEPFNDLAASLFVLQRDAEAIAILQRSLALNPDMAEAQETDAIWLLRYGRFREGWRKYEARFRTRKNQFQWRTLSQPFWQGERLDGKTILLHAEQGLGDAVQFARYVPMVAARGGRVILEVYKEALPIMRDLHGVARLIARGEPLPAFDVHCPLLSLPLKFATDLDSIPANIPYLTVPAEKLKPWREKLGPRKGLRVGIAVSGNPRHRDDARRSIALETFLKAFAGRPDAELHFLQDQVRPSDEAALQGHPNLHSHVGELHDFGDTGALIAQLDIVVSVDTSVAHLAGALGRPVWLLLAHLADWRWLLERDDSPWYPTMRLFRQVERGDWTSVLAAVGSQLEAL